MPTGASMTCATTDRAVIGAFRPMAFKVAGAESLRESALSGIRVGSGGMSLSHQGNESFPSGGFAAPGAAGRLNARKLPKVGFPPRRRPGSRRKCPARRSICPAAAPVHVLSSRSAPIASMRPMIRAVSTLRCTIRRMAATRSSGCSNQALASLTMPLFLSVDTL